MADIKFDAGNTRTLTLVLDGPAIAIRPVIGGSAGGGGTVTSVNGDPGPVVVLDQDDIPDGTTAKQYSATDKAKLAALGAGANVVGPASSVDSEVALFDSTTGKLLKRATGTGPAKLTSGVLSAAPINLSGAEVTGNLPVSKLNSGTSASSTTFWRGDGTWSVPAGAGDVVGPASAVGDNVTSFNSTTGKIIKDSGLAVSAVATLTGTQALTNKDISSGTNTFPTNLATLNGLTATTGNVIQSVSGSWASRTMAQLKTTMAIVVADISDFASSVASAITTERTAVATYTNKDLSSGTNTFPTFNQNTTGSAAKWTTARTVALTGDVTYSQSVDGSANVTGAATLATVNSNTGSFGGAASVATFSVNGKGLITSAGSTSIAIPGSAITSGTVGTARLGSGSASSLNFLRGNQTWDFVNAVDIETALLGQPADSGAPTNVFVVDGSGNWQIASLTAADVGAAPSTRTIINDTTTAHTVTSSMADNIITRSNASASTETIHGTGGSMVAIGQSFDIINLGAGTVTLTPGTGTPTLTSSGAGLKLVQRASCTVTRIASNQYYCVGALTA